MSILGQWRQRQHKPSEILLSILSSSLIDLINKGGGIFQGTYNDILKNAGLPYDLSTIDNYYGDLFNEMNKIKSTYGIESKAMGSKGAKYWFKEEIPSQRSLEELRKTLTNANFQQISDVELKAVIILAQRFL